MNTIKVSSFLMTLIRLLRISAATVDSQSERKAIFFSMTIERKETFYLFIEIQSSLTVIKAPVHLYTPIRCLELVGRIKTCPVTRISAPLVTSA